jgi:Domain of unknown function (DUF4276)
MSRPLHIHVEEPSMEAFLEELLPRILSPDLPFKIINHESKTQLLAEVPKRLLGYTNYPHVATRPKALVLVDRDADDCAVLKGRLEKACRDAQLASKTVPAHDGTFEVVNRIVVEELEAWYFGAVPELVIEFPGVPATLANKQGFRDPDAVRGGTHEQLLKVLQRAGHYTGLDRLPKIATARRMGKLIDPQSNRSVSFSHFLSGLRAIII